MAVEPIITRSPHAWVIHRMDGTYAAQQSIGKLGEPASLALAESRAANMDLSHRPMAANRVSFSSPPKAQVSVSRRFRGGYHPIPEQWRIRIALRLVLCSIRKDSQRKHRWTQCFVGSLHEITNADIQQAWAKVYGEWAWVSGMKAKYPPADIYTMEPPEDCSEYLALLDLPQAPTVEMIWDRLAYDPATGRDVGARKEDIKRFLGR